MAAISIVFDSITHYSIVLAENQASVKGDVAPSKAEAKMLAAKLANIEVSICFLSFLILFQIFGLDLDNIPEKPAIPVPACQKLQILLMKKNRGASFLNFYTVFGLRIIKNDKSVNFFDI